MHHRRAFLIALLTGTAWAGVPTPDNVDLNLTARPSNPTLGAFEPETYIPPDPDPDVCSQPGNTCTYRVNIAGPQYVDTNGDTWESCNTSAANPCQYVTWTYAGAGFYCKGNAIANTLDDTLYQCLGAALDGNGTPLFNIDFNVPSGDYEVTLLFQEDWRTAANEREFDILVEGTVIESAWDIWTEAGGAQFTAVDRVYEVAVTDGQLNIDLRPINGYLQPILAGVQVLAIGEDPDVPDPTGAFVPYGFNDVMPQLAHVRPVILPANDNRTRAGYTSIAVPDTCDHTFETSDNEATVESELNNTGNGPVFCIPVDADFSAFVDVDLTRDCSVNGDAAGRCWIVPEDIATRTLTAFLEQAPAVGHFDLGNAAHGWSFVGLRFDGSGDVSTAALVGASAGNTPDDVLIAYSELTDAGASGASSGAIEARGDDWVIYSNTIWDSYVNATGLSSGIIWYGGGNIYINRNTFRDLAGHGVQIDSAATANGVHIVNNHFELTDALRTGLNGTTPTGNSTDGYVCAERAIDAQNGGSEGANEGFIYGNIIHGWRPGEGDCSGNPGDNAAIAIHNAADAYNIFFNAIYDTHYAISGGTDGAGTDGSTISANFIEIPPVCDGLTGCENRAFSTTSWGGDPQVFGFNTIKCTGRWSSDSTEPTLFYSNNEIFDAKSNLFIGCGAPEGSTQNATLLNVYINQGVSGSEVPALTDTQTFTQGLYGNFSVYSEICSHNPAPANCAVKTYTSVVPPVGGVVDTSPLFLNPSFTSGRGTSIAPKQKWAEW